MSKNSERKVKSETVKTYTVKLRAVYENVLEVKAESPGDALLEAKDQDVMTDAGDLNFITYEPDDIDRDVQLTADEVSDIQR